MRMSRLGPNPDSDGGPRIAYPPPDARLELAVHEPLALSALGGSGRLRWLIDGKPIDGARWTPQNPGQARVAVVDDTGRSSAVVVHIVRRP
jgi:penicillin-binding protein 1C